METVQFNVRDAELLYSFPKPWSDLTTVIRCFKFLNRTAAPTYEELTSCLMKAQRAGIIQEAEGKYIVENQWYDKIHAADESEENEIEAMLSFEETFVNIDFAEVTKRVTTLSKEDFQAIVDALR